MTPAEMTKRLQAQWRRRHEGHMKATLKLAEAGGFYLPRLQEKLNIKKKMSQRIVDELIKEGKLIRSKTGHRSVLYELPHRPKPKPQPSVYIPPPKKLDPNAPLIITENTKITICPSPSSGQFHKSQFSNW